MENKFSVARASNVKFKTYEEAESMAKRNTANDDDVWTVLQAVAFTKAPVPEIEIVKL